MDDATSWDEDEDSDSTGQSVIIKSKLCPGKCRLDMDTHKASHD